MDIDSINRAETAANIARNVAERLRARSEVEITIPGIGRIERRYLAEAFDRYASDLAKTAWDMRHGEDEAPVPEAPAPEAPAPEAPAPEAPAPEAPAPEAPRRGCPPRKPVEE